MVSERGPVHFGDPGRVKRQAAPGHTTSWTVWFFTEKSKATRAGRSGGTAGIASLESQGGSADTRGGLRAPGLRARLKFQHVAQPHSHPRLPGGDTPQGPSVSRGGLLEEVCTKP